MRRSPKINYASIVQDLLEKTGGNQSRLAERLGVKQPTISRWISGDQEPEKVNHARILAVAGEMGVVKVEEPNGIPIPIVGHIGPRAEVHFHTDLGEQLGEAPVPPKGPVDQLVALVVREDAMGGQVDDGSLVYYEDHREPPTGDLTGRLCVVGLSDGRILIRRLVTGSAPGRYHLVGANTTTMLDQLVEWAALVAWIAPA